MPESEKESRSSRALAAFLEERGVTAIAQLTKIHRTQLWKYATGKRKPDADQIAKLHRVSDGLVAAEGWESVAASPEDGHGDNGAGPAKKAV
jgi:transcriptional regulator with XRE-family HTH domain